MRIDYGKLLMWSAVIVSMPRWAGAFISADVASIPDTVNEALHFANLFSGVGMGLLEVLAAAYMLEAWGKLKPRKTWNAKSLDHRWVVLTIFVAGLFILMPFILAPYVVSRMTAVSIDTAITQPFWRYAWATAVVLSPAFIVGGVAVANGELVSSDKPKTKAPKTLPKASETRGESAKTLPKPKRLSGNKLKVYNALRENPETTNVDIAESLTITPQRVGQIRKELNGSIKAVGDE